MDRDEQRRVAVELFNHVWTLLERDERTRDDDDEMLHAAHASRFHWGEVGEPVNRVRGEWQCSRVYAALARSEPALHHARRCLELCEQFRIADFDLGYAYEALARAHALAGDADEAARWKRRARSAADAIADDDDREHFLGDLLTLP